MNEQFQKLIELISNMPLLQAILVFMSAVSWFGGMKILISSHLKRVNPIRENKLQPSDLVHNLFNTFNIKEWFLLMLVLVTSFSFIIFALNSSKL